MSDIGLFWDSKTQSADVQTVLNDLVVDETFDTAVYLSLFTDRYVEPGQPLPDGSPNRRGWWGDAFALFAGDKFGSRLWTLARATAKEALLQTPDICKEALQWFVDDGVAARVDVESGIVPNNPTEVLISVAIYKPNVADPVRYAYNYNWAAQAASVA